MLNTVTDDTKTLAGHPDVELPEAVQRRLDDPDTRNAVLRPDGRIVAIGPYLLNDLGFEHGDDLRGLAFASFWHHTERPLVAHALQQARTGKRSELRLDLSYTRDREGTCDAALEPIEGSELILVDLRCDPART